MDLCVHMEIYSFWNRYKPREPFVRFDDTHKDKVHTSTYKYTNSQHNMTKLIIVFFLPSIWAYGLLGTVSVDDWSDIHHDVIQVDYTISHHAFDYYIMSIIDISY
jgi:hypothetical protein